MKSLVIHCTSYLCSGDHEAADSKKLCELGLRKSTGEDESLPIKFKVGSSLNCMFVLKKFC